MRFGHEARSNPCFDVDLLPLVAWKRIYRRSPHCPLFLPQNSLPFLLFLCFVRVPFRFSTNFFFVLFFWGGPLCFPLTRPNIICFLPGSSFPPLLSPQNLDVIHEFTRQKTYFLFFSGVLIPHTPRCRLQSRNILGNMAVVSGTEVSICLERKKERKKTNK